MKKYSTLVFTFVNFQLKRKKKKENYLFITKRYYMRKEDIQLLTDREISALFSHLLTYPTLSLNLKLIFNKYTRLRFGYALFPEIPEIPEIVEIKKDPLDPITKYPSNRDLLKEEEKLLESTIKVLDNLLKEIVKCRQQMEKDEDDFEAQFESQLNSYIDRDPDWK